jgi:hypothetical protein
MQKCNSIYPNTFIKSVSLQFVIIAQLSPKRVNCTLHYMYEIDEVRVNHLDLRLLSTLFYLTDTYFHFFDSLVTHTI